MQLSSALSQVSINSFTEFTAINKLLDPDLVSNALSQAGVATIRKRKLPMGKMVWAVVGMALFRKYSMRQLVNQLDIILPNGEPYAAPSAVTQVRKKLGHQAIEYIFNQTPPCKPFSQFRVGEILHQSHLDLPGSTSARILQVKYQIWIGRMYW